MTPSISLLLSFEAAARHSNFTKAARELHLTQSAVSRQVQALEAMLKTRLFERAGRSIQLTTEGELYAHEVRRSLDGIRRASMQIYGSRDGRTPMKLAVLPIFGSKWLMPRIGRFYDEHPNALIDFHARVNEFDLPMSSMDACIMMGDGHWPSLMQHHLMDARGLVVASPALLEKRPIRRATDLLDHTLLQITSHFPGWQECLLASDVDPRRITLGPKFEYTAHLIQACVSGVGVGLVSDLFVQDELDQGTLLAPDLPDLASMRKSYYFLHTPEKASHPTLILFRDWLLREARQPVASA